MLQRHKLSLAMAASLLATGASAAGNGAFPPMAAAPVVQPTAAFKAQPAPAAPAQAQLSGYLGVGVDKVPASVRAHYPESADEADGLIVTQFADSSPAADHGIKLHDVLLSYDGQPIKDPRAFIQKIHQDKPGRTVKFKLLRQGELLTVPVVIGQQKILPPAPVQQWPQHSASKPFLPPAPPMPHGYGYGYGYQPAMPASGMRTTAPNPGMRAAPAGAPPAMPAAPPGKDFNGLAIRRIGEDIYDASIGFTAHDGSQQRRSFKGAREQILQQIMSARDLPPAERQQLIFAVKPKKKKSSGWGGMPFGDGNMFNPSKFFKGWGW